LTHIEECENCRKTYEEILEIKEELKNTEFVPLPEGFHFELTKKLKEEGKKNNKKVYVKYASVAAAAVMVFVGGTAVGGSGFGMQKSAREDSAVMYTTTTSSAGGTMNYKMESAVVTEEAVEMEMAMGAPMMDASAPMEPAVEIALASEEGAVNETPAEEGRKLIKNGYIHIAVEDYDIAENSIRNYIDAIEGYVENSDSWVEYDHQLNIYDRKNGHMTLRVDKNDYISTMEYLKGLGNVRNENENTEDVTASYVDTESRLKVKQEEKERLMKLLESAESIEDIITIEARLSEVISEIESYEAKLKNYDRLVEFSRINIDITEETKPVTDKASQTTFRDRAAYNFNESIENMIEFVQNVILTIINLWVPIAILIVCVPFGFIILRKIIRKIRRKK